MIADIALVGSLFLYSCWLEWRHKRQLRHRIVAALDEERTKPAAPLPPSGSATTPVIPNDRNHPLYSIGGGRRGPEQTLPGRFR